MKESSEQDLLDELGTLTDEHANAMAQMSKALVDLSIATDKTLEATRNAIDVSKRVSSLMMILVASTEETPH